MKNTNNSIGTIVIGDHVQALGIIRSLGRHNIPVYLLHDKSFCIGKFSKYMKKFVKCPDINNSSMLVDFLVEFAKKEKVKNWIIMPTNDAAVYALSKNKKTLEEYYKVPTPSWNVVKFAYNKKLTYQIAEKNNIPVPYTICPNNMEELKNNMTSINYPVLIKGLIGHKFYKRLGVKGFTANSDKELINKYAECSRFIEPSEIIVQEIVSGSSPTYSFCSFFKDGEVMGQWIGIKIREHPTKFGTATFAKSVMEPEIIDLGTRFLKSINYYGISEIEFKKDMGDGKFKLIEMNARTWLFLSLATRCGVNLPLLLYNDLVGGENTLRMSFETDVKWIHLWTDIFISTKKVFSREMTFEEYLSSISGNMECGVFSIADPLPFIIETLILPYLRSVR